MRDAANRRDFLKYACVAGGAGLAGVWPSGSAAATPAGNSFVLQANRVRLYMTHYALFDEPDPNVPPGIYIDAATGLPTDELTLTPPCEGLTFGSSGHNPTQYTATASSPVKQLPYFVSPPGFPPLPAPPEVVGAIGAVLQGAVPPAVIAANTKPLLVAIGHFEPTAGDIKAQLAGASLSITRDTRFQVK